MFGEIINAGISNSRKWTRVVLTDAESVNNVASNNLSLDFNRNIKTNDENGAVRKTGVYNILLYRCNFIKSLKTKNKTNSRF